MKQFLKTLSEPSYRCQSDVQCIQLAGWHFGHVALAQASELCRQIVPHWPGFSVLFGVSSEPPASLRTGIRVLSWSCLTWSLSLRLICPTLNHSTAETQWQKRELASGRKIPLEVRKAAKPLVSGLTHSAAGRWAFWRWHPSQEVGQPAVCQVGSLMQMECGFGAVMQIQRGQGWNAQQSLFQPANAKVKQIWNYKEGKKPQE